MEKHKNKVVYITGGTKGIGLGVAQTLKGAGMRQCLEQLSYSHLLYKLKP